VRRHDGRQSSSDQANAVAVSPDGGTVYVTGSSTNAGLSHEYDTFAYDAATGAVVWQRGYSPKHNDAYATAIGVSPDGGTVFVTGYSAAWGTLADYATVAFNTG
jgi:outer membrane protein assembly factor BamB